MLIESVPNFSEGRDRGTVESIVAAMGDCVLDWSLDADHHRSVVTAAAERNRLLEAVLAGAGQAAGKINLNSHSGVHPRNGALDVLPFVPLRGATLHDCANVAAEAGERLWSRFGIPVFLYGEAARRSERIDLASVRREIRVNPFAQPDIGDPGGHPTAGLTIVGARFFLIAYNVNLDSNDLAAAKAIAARIRRLPHVRALGLPLASSRRVQVSMNLTDYRVTGIRAAYEAVFREAATLGVVVKESELIGLAPPAALNDDIAAHVRLRGYQPRMILPASLF